MPPMIMNHAQSPEQAILDAIGDLSKVKLLFGSVLVATYVRPETTKSGIILTEKYRDEDFYQGKVGLVLMKGSRAYVDDGDVKFNGENINTYDWVVYRPSDGWDVTVNKVRCRILQDVHIKMKIDTPDVVW